MHIRLSALEEEVKDLWFVAFMLSSLPESYDKSDGRFCERKVALDEGKRRLQNASLSEKALATGYWKEKFPDKHFVKKINGMPLMQEGRSLPA